MLAGQLRNHHSGIAARIGWRISDVAAPDLLAMQIAPRRGLLHASEPMATLPHAQPAAGVQTSLGSQSMCSSEELVPEAAFSRADRHENLWRLHQR